MQDFEKRSFPRQQASQGTIATIDINSSQHFAPTIVALVLNTSSKGCGLTLAPTPALQVADRCTLQIGSTGTKHAQVKWRTETGDQTVKIGLLFLD